MSEHAFVGLSDCALCHEKGFNSNPATGRVFDGWVRGNEYLTWLNEDKHSWAFTSLLDSNELSRQIGRNLGIKKIHRDKRCLACHTGFPLNQMEFENVQGAELLKSPPFTDLRVAEGVSCEGCHGSAGQRLAGDDAREGWLNVHRKKDEWRFKSAADKWEQFGYYDVRSTVSRTRMCASCHIGNAQEGKVLTHEMYAAGHPPLPGFEVETFTYQMPAHWRSFSDKPEEVRAEYLAKADFRHEPSDLPKSKALLVGSLVAFAASADLTADLATSDPDRPIPGPSWPEFAQFACFACHHELQEGGWRSTRNLTGALGRPFLHEWPGTVVQLVLRDSTWLGEELKAATALREKLGAVNLELAARPFGDPGKLADVLRGISEQAMRLAHEIEAMKFDGVRTLDLLSHVASFGAENTLDYDSARQLVWTFEMVSAELSSSDLSADVAERLAAVKEPLADLQSGFLLNLKEGREARHRIPGAEQDRIVTEVDLDKVLAPIRAYDPKVVRDKFKLIATQLDQP